MAYLVNEAQHYSFDESTVREDLSDLIAIMSPVDMPLFSILEHVPIANRQYDWALDTIPVNRTITSIAGDTRFEGSDATFRTPAHRTRIHNFAQINHEGIDVADTARVVDMAGVDDEYDYQGWRELLSLGTKMEFAAHYGKGAVDSGTQNGGTKRMTHGIFNWIAQTGLQRGIGGAAFTAGQLFAGSAALPTDFFSWWYENAGATPISRTTLANNILAPGWRNGFSVNGAVILCGTLVKQAISNFSILHPGSGDGAVNARWLPAERRMLIDTLDMIETTLGTIYINLDRYMDLPAAESITYTTPAKTVQPGEALLAINPDMFKISILRGVGFKPLATVGDSTKGMLVGEWGTKVLTPIAGVGGGNLVTGY